jgi:hypothetical protein
LEEKCWATSLLPEPLEPVVRQLAVAHGVGDVLVPEIVLQGSRIVAIVGKFVAAGMTQHVRMYGKGNSSLWVRSTENLSRAPGEVSGIVTAIERKSCHLPRITNPPP